MDLEKIRPNFFIIGAPKSGTTALTEYLQLHSSVFFCPIKEPEFFATDFDKPIVTSEKTYLRLFRSADPSRYLAIGESSTGYLFSKVAVSNILQFQPSAKIIVMLRNPVDLVVSFHSQLLKSGDENLSPFLDAWNAETDRRQKTRIPLSCRNPQLLYYSEWGKLGSQLKRVMEIVPQRQLKVIFFDDFVHDTRAVYQATLEFLGLQDDGRTQFPIINERRKPKSVFLQGILGLATQYWLPVRVRIMNGKGFGLGNFINKFITSESAKEQIPNHIRQMLLDYYKDEVFLLEKLLGRDLACWKESDQLTKS